MCACGLVGELVGLREGRWVLPGLLGGGREALVFSATTPFVCTWFESDSFIAKPRVSPRSWRSFQQAK